jgi:replicative DNA helicase
MSTSWENLDDLFDAVKKCDLRRVLPQLGIEVRHDLKLQQNPLREERTSSINVIPLSPNRWKDHGSGESGDLIDLLMKRLQNPLSKAEAYVEAARVLGVDLKPKKQGTHPQGGRGMNTSLKPDTAKTTPKPVELEEPPAEDFSSVIDQAHDALLLGQSAQAKTALGYLKARGFDPRAEGWNAVLHARLGVIDATVDLPASMDRRVFDGRIVFPYVDQDGRTRFLNARRPGVEKPEDGEADRRYRKPTGARQQFAFNQNAVTDSDFVIMVEGEFDALAVLEAFGGSAPVVANGGGSPKPAHLQQLAKHATQFFALFDGDASGQGFVETAKAILEPLGASVHLLALPEGLRDPGEALVELGAEGLRDVLDRQISAERRVDDVGFLKVTFLEELNRRFDRPFEAYSTGIKGIDAALDGGYGEGLHLLGGVTGNGKTSLALSIAVHNALLGRPVLFATFEQSRMELWAKIAASFTGLDQRQIKRGAITDPFGNRAPVSDYLQQHGSWSKMLKTAERLVVIEGGDAFSRREGERSIDQIRILAERLRRDAGAPPLVIVDYLQRVPVASLAGRDVRERVDYVAGLLQVGIAREVGSPVLALSSLNRAGMGQADEKLSVEDRLKALKESGGLEYTSYTVGMLFRYRKGEEPAGLTRREGDAWEAMGFVLPKNRDGIRIESAVGLMWNHKFNSWEEPVAKAIPR